MRVTQAEFKAALRGGDLAIAFVGMSNIGKSHTAARLVRHVGFSVIEFDLLIAKALGISSMDELAQWMGFPASPGYEGREQRYVATETAEIEKALGLLSDLQILDVTGSVIYCDPAVLKTLNEKALIIHLKAEPEDLAHLQDLFYASPKPLAWNGQFAKDEAQSEREAMAQCYPALLASRQAAYDTLADVTLSAAALRQMDSDDALVNHLISALPLR